MSGEPERVTKVLRVATRCTSLDQFVEAFARYCEKRTLFIASMSTRAPGTQSPFVILLSDGSQALRGTCEVVDAWATPSGPFRRPGVRVKFLQLDAASESVLVRLHKFKPAPPTQPKPPVLPPLPALKTQIGVAPKTPAPGTPVVVVPPASVPTAVPAVLGPLSRATVRAQAVPPPTSTGLPPLAKPATPPAGTPMPTPAPAVIPPRATPPTGSATATSRMAGLPKPESTPVPQLVPPARVPSNVPEPVDAPYAERAPEPELDDALTDVQGNAEALRAIREAAPTDPPPMNTEERAPGSPIILPANPLAEITDDSLRGFVECTLFEETGQFKFDDLLDRAGTDSDLDDPIAEPPGIPDLRASLPPELKPILPRRDQTPIPSPRRDQTPLPSAAAPSAAPVEIAPQPSARVAAAAAVEAAASAHTAAAAAQAAANAANAVAARVDGTIPPPFGLGPIPGSVAAPMPQAPPAMFGDLAMPPAAGSSPLASPPVYIAPPPPPPMRPSSASVDDDLLPPRRNNLLFIGLGIAAVAIAAVVVILIINSGSNSKANASNKKPDTLAKTETGKKPPDTLAGSASGAGTGTATGSGTASGSGTATGSDSASGSGTGTGTSEAGAGASEAGAGTGTSEAGTDVGSEAGAGELTAADRLPPPVGDCSANIVSVPAGALVRANGRYYGETPLQAALPCGRVTLSIAYRRYATVEKTMTFSADKPADLRIAMERPKHKVKIVSTPGGATVTVNGSKIGTTPLTASLPGFSMLSIEMRRAGYKTVRTKHYSKRNGEVVAARLEKGK